ncbi:MAG: cation-translocating P-type ATPase [Candidatus Thermoplasmatota archaeon]|nr:cation-translocating P-type ATPase [Candidatus Thermoplasmatota archaeon]
MSDGLDECPYCEIRVKNIDRHIELKHEQFTLKRFLLDSKITIITGSILASALFFILLDFHPLIIGGLHLHEILMASSVAVGGIPLAKEGIRELVEEKKFDVDSLVVVAAVGAVFINYWTEAGVLIFLFSLAETLEDYSVFRSRKTLKNLLDLSPGKARVLREGEYKLLEPKLVEIDDIVAVKPGERIPIDGEIEEGNSAIDESPITGESIPKEKEPGDKVYAGTLNKNGSIKIRTEKRSVDSTLSRIVSAVENAEVHKADTEKFVNRFASYYTPVILLLSAGVLLIPTVLFNLAFETWLYRALVMLVLSCPCAFVVSTPVTMLSAVTGSAKNGVLVKGGAYLEKIRETSILAFDKTGTLTEGEPEMSEIVTLDKAQEREVLKIAASLEYNSTHPLAEPIVEKFERTGMEDHKVKNFRSLTGMGVKGKIEDSVYRIGKPELFDLTEKMRDKMEDMASRGETVIVLGTEKRPIALIGLRDKIRPAVKDMMSEVKKKDIKTVMITGDNEETAAAVAEEIGIDGYKADVLPVEKVDEVKKLKEEGTVTMVGDGINDAPALMESDIGVAMGAAGSDTAMESADMALMEDDLSKLMYLFDLSDKTMRVVKENIYSAIGVKAVLAGLAVLGLVTLSMAVGIGDAGMAFLVTMNALLLSYR